MASVSLAGFLITGWDPLTEVETSTNQVTADFSIPVDYPLLKTKFNLYNTALPSTASFDRDAKLLQELNVDSIRIEHNWGFNQTLSHTVGGTLDALTFDWTLPDRWQKDVWDQNVLFHWGYDYTPYPLATSWAAPPPIRQWREISYATARHLRETGSPVIYHEVWNEPDIPPTFFSGTIKDYEDLYANTVKEIKAADSDAKVGGPTVALTGWYDRFLHYVRKNALPLDFFSFHHYGAPGLMETSLVAKALAKDRYFNMTEMVMDEYNTYQRWLKGGPQDTYVGATELLHDFMTFLERPELTSVNWAQFEDPCVCGGPPPDQFLGLVTLDGHRKATFNAFKIYGMMPVDRNQAGVRGVHLEAVASSDSHKASLVLLNRTGESQAVAINLKNIPFPKANINVYRIDQTHSSYGDGAGEELMPTESFENIGTADWSWQGEIPNSGTLYFQADDGTDVSELAPVKVARIIRLNRYYPARGTTSYSDFDRKTWIARLGMADNRLANQEVGVTVEEIPSTLEISTKVDGNLQRLDSNSLLGLRLDYRVKGVFTKSVLFHGRYQGRVDLWDSRRTAQFPWGTRRQADETVAVPNMASFQIKPRMFAPANWDGRAEITFVMQNSGQGTRAKMIVRAQLN
jgi:hypothetical protein